MQQAVGSTLAIGTFPCQSGSPVEEGTLLLLYGTAGRRDLTDVSGTMRDTTDRSDLMDVSGILLSICICLAPSNGILKAVAVALRLSATTLRIAS